MCKLSTRLTALWATLLVVSLLLTCVFKNKHVAADVLCVNLSSVMRVRRKRYEWSGKHQNARRTFECNRERLCLCEMIQFTNLFSSFTIFCYKLVIHREKCDRFTCARERFLIFNWNLIALRCKNVKRLFGDVIE